MKQKPHTPFITGLLKKTLGEDADTGTLAVFEVVATSSRPLKKKGSIYENAVITPLTLAQMAAHVNRDPIPFMQDHNMQGAPKGKFFYAEMRQDSGTPELRGMFYIDPTETDMIAKMNTGTSDEVSVGFLPSSIKCSACKFDYMAALRAGKYEPMLDRKCENGHKLNQNGVHAMVDGLEDFMELSSVSRGAAPNSKIIGNDNAKLDQHIEKLAASGFDVNELYLTASASEGEDNVDLSELVAQLSDTKAAKMLVDSELTNVKASLKTATDTIVERDATIASLTTERDEALAASAPSEDAAALTAATDFLKGQYTAILTAAGKKDFTVPETVAELVAGISENRAALTAILPIGGVALSAGADEIDSTTGKEINRLAAFKNK